MTTSVTMQFLRFSGVGAVGTAVHYATLAVLVELVGTWPTAASAAGFALGACVNYILNRSYTFDSHVRHTFGLPRFLLVASLGAVLNILIFMSAFHGLSIHYFAAQFLATILVLTWNFLGNRYWTFRHVCTRPLS